VALAGACYVICYFLFRDISGLAGLMIRSIACVVLFTSGVFYLKLSPDVQPVLHTVYKRLRLRRNQ